MTDPVRLIEIDRIVCGAVRGERFGIVEHEEARNGLKAIGCNRQFCDGVLIAIALLRREVECGRRERFSYMAGIAAIWQHLEAKVRTPRSSQPIFELHMTNHNDSKASGQSTSGDVTSVSVGGDATNLAAGRKARAKADDVSLSNVMNTGVILDSKTVRAFRRTASAIKASKLNQEDKEDAEANLSNLKKELEKPEPEPSRMRRFFARVVELLPSAATILESSTKLAGIVKMLG